MLLGRRRRTQAAMLKPPPPLVYSIVPGRIIATQSIIKNLRNEERKANNTENSSTEVVENNDDMAVNSWKPSEIVDKFLESSRDDETEEFLKRSSDGSNAYRDMLAGFLKYFMSVTDANGIAKRGELYVFSQKQLLTLLNETTILDKLSNSTDSQVKMGELVLDVGAGCGAITEKVAPFFNHVVTTEVSGPMVRTLKGRGFSCVQCTELDPATLGARCYDLVMCLNVLDRADKPHTLLRQLRSLLKTDGKARLVLAVVLPWCPFVESGTQQLKPSEELPMNGGRCKEGASFEASVAVLVENVLRPCGFELERWTRLPYISQGDQVQDYYVLTDAVFILKSCPIASEEDTTVIQPSCL